LVKLTDSHNAVRIENLNVKIAGAARQIWRRVVPVSLRAKVWDLIVKRYFERASIRKVVAHVRNAEDSPSSQLQRLLTVLEANKFRPEIRKIRDEIGFDIKSYSYQDLITYLYFKGKPDGFFIDIGAYDGVEISNTYALEQIGWAGICIEPIPEVFERLRNNRGCHCYNVAVSSIRNKEANFVKVPNMLGLSGLEQQMPERIFSGLAQKGLEVEQISVSTIRFGGVMKNHPDVSHIDFLSVDVEGGELDVLDTIDFEQFTFGMITIENNVGEEVLHKFMGCRGYKIFLNLGVDLMFIPERSSS
jgi:FkbM family methyltransferase